MPAGWAQLEPRTPLRARHRDDTAAVGDVNALRHEGDLGGAPLDERYDALPRAGDLDGPGESTSTVAGVRHSPVLMTVVLFHLEGTRLIANDASATQNHGPLNDGGAPMGPRWSTDTPF
jgi:hypothetical protein